MGHVDARDSNPTKEIVGDKGDVWVRGLAHIHAGQTLAAQVGDLDAPASKLLRLKFVHLAIAHLEVEKGPHRLRSQPSHEATRFRQSKYTQPSLPLPCGLRS